MPAPPYSSGKRTPVKPSAASFGCSSIGKCCASSHSNTCGAISASANSRTLCLTCCCSSVNSNSMLVPVYQTQQRHPRLSDLTGRNACLKQQIVKIPNAYSTSLTPRTVTGHVRLDCRSCLSWRSLLHEKFHFVGR